MSKTETPFIEKTCPLIDRKCIREECVAYRKDSETYYVSNGSEGLEIRVPYKDGKLDRVLKYNMFEANIDEKITMDYIYCENYKKSHTDEKTESVNGEVVIHGEDMLDTRYNGLWVKYNNHNKDTKTAVDGKWEYKHNV